MRRLGVLAACWALACGHTDEIRPADVPRLERLGAEESVTVTRLDGEPLEIVRYKEVRLIPKGDTAGYVLRRPIRVRRFEGEVWLRSGRQAPILFDAERYSRAEIEHSDRDETATIVISASVAGLLAAFLIVPPHAVGLRPY